MLRPISEFSPAEHPETGIEYVPNFLIVRGMLIGPGQYVTRTRRLHLVSWDSIAGFFRECDGAIVHDITEFAITNIPVPVVPSHPDNIFAI